MYQIAAQVYVVRLRVHVDTLPVFGERRREDAAQTVFVENDDRAIRIPGDRFAIPQVYALTACERDRLAVLQDGRVAVPVQRYLRAAEIRRYDRLLVVRYAVRTGLRHGSRNLISARE